MTDHEHVYVDDGLGWSHCQVPGCRSWYRSGPDFTRPPASGGRSRSRRKRRSAKRRRPSPGARQDGGPQPETPPPDAA